MISIDFLFSVVGLNILAWWACDIFQNRKEKRKENNLHSL